MEEFSPLLVMGILWLFIGLPIMKMSQAAKKNAAKRPQNPPQKPVQQQAPAARQAAPAVPAVSDTERFPPRGVLQSSITVSDDTDDSFYQGSMNAVTGEGCDPCHEEQLTPLSAAAQEDLPAAGAPGFQLNWSGDEVVKGLVMSEILKRK